MSLKVGLHSIIKDRICGHNITESVLWQLYCPRVPKKSSYKFSRLALIDLRTTYYMKLDLILHCTLLCLKLSCKHHP